MKILFIIGLICILSICSKKQQILNHSSTDYTVQNPVKKLSKPVIKVKEPDFFDFRDEFTGTIYFSFDSDGIEDISAFHKILKFANKFPDKEIILTGGCCPIGEWEYNRKLGLRRGNSCYKYLRPLIKNEMYVVSVGEDELETEDKAEYWLNRRCEVEIK